MLIAVIQESPVYLSALELPPPDTKVYRIRSDGTALTLLMPDSLAMWLMGLVFIVIATVLVVAGLSGLAHVRSTAWYEPLLALLGGTMFALIGIPVAR
jgi:hypothetical protein